MADKTKHSDSRIEVTTAPQLVTRTVRGVPFSMVWVPPGRFLMGSADSDPQADRFERPRRELAISRPLEVGVVPVTQGLYEAVVGRNPSHFVGTERPVEQVSWHGAVAFCDALSRELGFREAYRGTGDDVSCDFDAAGFRLPTEAEWEYACRAGTDSVRYGEAHEIAWYEANSGGSSQVVAQLAPNAWGLFDTLGNVSEWCWDWFSLTEYERDPVADPDGPDLGTARVGRGGSWGVDDAYIRAACRFDWKPDLRAKHLGFRLFRSVVDTGGK